MTQDCIREAATEEAKKKEEADDDGDEEDIFQVRQRCTGCAEQKKENV